MTSLRRSRKANWSVALILWLSAAIPSGFATPYHLVRKWPDVVDAQLLGFVKDQDAILIWAKEGPSEVPDLLPGELKLLDLRTGVAKDLLHQETQSGPQAYRMVGGRWVLLLSKTKENRFWSVYDIKTQRRFELMSTGSSSFLNEVFSSPKGKFLTIGTEDDGFRIFNLSGDEPEVVENSIKPNGFNLNFRREFHLDESGIILAWRKTDETGIETKVPVGYFGPSKGWRELADLVDLSSGTSQPMVKGRMNVEDDGTILITTLLSDQPMYFRLDLATRTTLALDGPPSDSRPSATLELDPYSDPFLRLIDKYFPKLGIPEYRRWSINYIARDGSVTTLETRPSEKRSMFVNFMLEEENQPYLVCADDAGVRVWNDPPQRSLSWFFAFLLAYGLPILGIALWRDRSIRKTKIS